MVQGTHKIGFGINGEQIQDIGLILSSVDVGSPLDKAGVQGGDIITSLDGIDMSAKPTLETYCNILTSKTSSSQVDIEIFRISDLSYYFGTLNSGLSIKLSDEFANTNTSSNNSGTTQTTQAVATTTSTTTTTAYVDNVSPKFNKNLTANNVKTSSVDLSWSATDNIAIDYYVCEKVLLSYIVVKIHQNWLKVLKLVHHILFQ